MNKWLRIALPIVILVIAFLIMRGLLGMKPEKSAKKTQLKTKTVETEFVRLDSHPTTIIAYGRLKSIQPVQLYSEVTGVLEKGDIPFQPAEIFSRGDLLAKIDNRQAKLNVDSKKAELMEALSNLLPEIKVNFPDEYQVWQDYFRAINFKRKIAELPKTNNPKIRLYLSRFKVQQLYLAVRNLEILLDKYSLVAPFNGAIVSVNQYVGSTARAGALLGEIVNLEEMEAEVQVDVSDIPWINMGEPVTLVSSELSRQWTGKITRIGSSIDARTQTVPVYVSVVTDENKPPFSGTFVKADITGKVIDSVMIIPRKALYENKYVYVIENGRLARKKVHVLRQEENMLFVNGEIADGDNLITDLMQGVAPGIPAVSKNTDSSPRQER